MPKYWVEDVNGTKVLHEYEDGTSGDPIVPSGSAPGREIASAVLSSTFTPASSAAVDVTGLSITVPANSGPANVGLVGGAIVGLLTGTNASTVSQRVSLYIVDELSTAWAYSPWILFGTGVSQSLTNTLALGAAVPNAATDKTYRVQIQVLRFGTLGASGNVSAGGIFPNLTFQAVRR